MGTWCVKTWERAPPLPLSSLPVPVKTPMSVDLPESTLPATAIRMSHAAPPVADCCGRERTSTSATRPLRTRTPTQRQPKKDKLPAPRLEPLGRGKEGRNYTRPSRCRMTVASALISSAIRTSVSTEASSWAWVIPRTVPSSSTPIW